MTSRLQLRESAPFGGAAWELDAVPLAYEEAGRQQFKAFPGLRWVRDRGSPNGRGYYRGPEEAVRIVTSLLESAGVLRLSGREASTLAIYAGPKPEVYEGLREYQNDGVSWLVGMLRHGGAALLADDMGLGKSPQSIRALDGLGSGTVLVVCQALAVRNWKRLIAQWATRDASSRAWIVMSHEMHRRAWEKGEIPAFSWLIVDEIQYYSNPKAKRTKAMVEMLAARRAQRSVQGVVGLSGTPMTAHIADLWQPLDLLWPGRFGRRFDFEKRYCDGRFVEIPNVEKAVWQASGASRLEELHTRLASVMLRRTKAMVGLELPPRTRTVIEVELPAKALKELARHSAAVDWNSLRGDTIAELLSNVEEHKIEAAIELARDVMTQGGRPLILTTRRVSAEAIGEALKAPVAHGEVPPEKREALLRDALVGVGTIYALTTSIDLVGFDSVIFVGFDWLPSTMLQAAARVHRIGQLRAVSEFYIVALRTLDEVVRAKVIERLDHYAEVMGGAQEEGDFSRDIGGGTEEDLLAAFAAAVMKQ